MTPEERCFRCGVRQADLPSEDYDFINGYCMACQKAMRLERTPCLCITGDSSLCTLHI